MRRFSPIISVFLTCVLAWSSAMQPFAIYAETVYSQNSATTASASDEGDGEKGVEGNEGSVSDEETGNQENTGSNQDDSAVLPESGEDTGLPSLDDGLSEQEDQDDAEAEIDNTANGFVENSWRYENGVLKSDLEPSARARRSSGNLPAGVTGWGIDVSSHQGAIDWAKVKAAGVDYAILRVGYGIGNSDGRFIENVKGCKENGIPFGVYLYSYAWDEQSAKSEAQGVLNLLSNAGVKPGDLAFPVYYDLENTVGKKNHPDYGKPAGVDFNNQYHVIRDNATFAKMATSFCSIISANGFTPGVYANLNWWRNYLTDPVFNNWDRWVAQYYTECTYQGTYSMWQYSSQGSVNGISGNVDMNYCYASFDNLGWYRVDGTWYYGQFDGTNRTGWFKEKNSWYWLDPASNGAMATGIVSIDGKMYLFDPAAGGAMRTSWIKYQNKWYYASASGVLCEGWKQIGGNWYYFEASKSCAMKTGWLLDGTTWYYLSGSGAMAKGWLKLGGLWYYLQSSGAMATGWQRVGGYWYYLDPTSGSMKTGTFFDGSRYSRANGSGHWLGYCTGWIKVNSVWYYVDNGVLRTGWSYINGAWYWFNNKGVMQTGWIVDSSGGNYYLEQSGAMHTGWLLYDGDWYYLQSNGLMVTGWRKIDGKTYYFYSDGRMASGVFEVDSVPYYASSSGALNGDGWFDIGDSTQCYVSKAGICSLFLKNGILYQDISCSFIVNGMVRVDESLFHADEITGSISSGFFNLPDGTTYFFDTETYKAHAGWKKVDGIWYYFDSSTCAMKTGWQKIGSAWYLLADSGEMKTGWQEVDGARYYLDPSSGAMKTGWQKVGSRWYLLSSSGAMLTGWQRVGGSYYYLDDSNNGAMLTGTHVIDGCQRRFSPSGAVDKYGWQNPAQYYQVSCQNVPPYNANAGIYSYVSPSKISVDASRGQVVEAFIQRAYDYLGTKYVWDYACAPGVGVDCSGLVNHCFYAVGMDTIYNPYLHMYDPWQDHNAENMRVDTRLMSVPIKDRRRGDLIFYKGHVAIYLGNDKIIHAIPPRVCISNINIGLAITGVKRPFVE